MTDPTATAPPPDDRLPAHRPLGEDELAAIDAWWRAANYLAVGQIYLLDDPLLREPLRLEHVKPRLLGHWGTTPGLNLIYAHLNRVIRRDDLDVIFVCGPGHGGPAVVASTYLEGSYSEAYPTITRDEAGLRKLVRQFSFPGGIPSHAAPETPGSINEGGELGYALVHAYGAVLDAPELIAACVIGDGEAETGALAASWHSNKFLDPVRDGAVLPILHLNGWKIANPTILARIPPPELRSLLEGYGHEVIEVEGDEPAPVHQQLAAALDRAVGRIREIRDEARARAAGGDGEVERPRWPMIVLRTPKGWTGPREVDGVRVEGTWRSHQVPLAGLASDPQHLAALEAWLRSYRPEELFDDDGRLRPELEALAPVGDRRMGANPRANGGLLLRDLDLPDFRPHAVTAPTAGGATAEATRVLGTWLRDVMTRNPDTFRIMGPDEVASNRLQAVFEASDRAWVAARHPDDDHLSPHGQVMEVLSEHLCQGWLEGYLLTGRHGLFTSYEAFIHIVDSMFNQHAKWLKTTARIPWRRPIASLNYLLSSHVWRQDHNGFSHQDPGFIDHVVNKKAEVVRVYLPPDANCLLSTMDHCLRSRDYVNVVVAGKQPAPSWLSIDDAVAHCARGIGVWPWAGNEDDGDPDVVLACAGDVPTLEALAAAALLHQHLPDLKVRVVNVVDLMRLQPDSEHPHGLSDRDFDALFTTDRPVIFAFHGYPSLIHRLTYRRTNHRNLHVRGYKEEGTTTTPFDMVMLNDLDRFRLVMDVIDRVPGLGGRAVAVRQQMADQRTAAWRYAREVGDDPPEIRDWALGVAEAVRALVVNVGSSSVKLRLLDDADRVLAAADPDPGALAGDGGVLAALGVAAGEVDAVGHRVVHGGAVFDGPVVVDGRVLAGIEALTPLAPLHQPRALEGIRAVRAALPDVPHVACFDTAFHRTIPDAAATYAIPEGWRRQHGIRRFGAHGLSHAHVARRAAELAGVDAGAARVVSGHLGAGASLAAVAGGRSVDTTMGFTPLEGLVMATRSGSIDPAIPTWLQAHAGLAADEVADALEHASGLLGLTGTADMREVLRRAAHGDPAASLGLAVAVHRLRAAVAAMAAAMGGVDVLAFAGGVGERAWPVRARVVDGLAFLGLALDDAANRAATADAVVSPPGSPVAVVVVEAREDVEIARQVRATLA